MRKDEAYRPTFSLTTLLGHADARHLIESSTNILDIARKLRLRPAEWTGILPSRPRDAMLWLTAYSTQRRRREGLGSGRSQALIYSHPFGRELGRSHEDLLRVLFHHPIGQEQDGQPRLPAKVDSKYVFPEDYRERIFLMQNRTGGCYDNFLLRAAGPARHHLPTIEPLLNRLRHPYGRGWSSRHHHPSVSTSVALLGLLLADRTDVLLSRPVDCSAWLTVYSSLGFDLVSWAERASNSIMLHDTSIASGQIPRRYATTRGTSSSSNLSFLEATARPIP